jgi:hypothetical protein
MQNITLSADSDVIARMRAFAAEHNTTVNQIVRDHFAELLGNRQDRQSLADEYVKFCLEHAGRSEEGWKFDREEIHRRGSDRG